MGQRTVWCCLLTLFQISSVTKSALKTLNTCLISQLLQLQWDAMWSQMGRELVQGSTFLIRCVIAMINPYMLCHVSSEVRNIMNLFSVVRNLLSTGEDGIMQSCHRQKDSCFKWGFSEQTDQFCLTQTFCWRKMEQSICATRRACHYKTKTFC